VNGPSRRVVPDSPQGNFQQFDIDTIKMLSALPVYAMLSTSADGCTVNVRAPVPLDVPNSVATDVRRR
jgi:hypothetical protein